MPYVEGDYILIKAILDSGAVDHVQPPEVAAMFPIEESYNSRAGNHFCSASGGEIPNLGKRQLFGLTDNFGNLAVTLQIGNGLEKTLLSVRKLTECGCRVVLDSQEGDYIHFRNTDRYIPVYQEDGLYKVNFWIDASKYKADMTAGTGNKFYYTGGEDMTQPILGDTDCQINE